MAAYVFGSPLTAGQRTDGKQNKILWIVQEPKGGNALSIIGRQVDTVGPSLMLSVPDDSGPGEIYPSIVDVPAPGCWHLSLSWGNNHASIDLDYPPN